MSEDNLDFDEMLERIIREKDQLPLGESDAGEGSRYAALDNLIGLTNVTQACSVLIVAIMLRLPDEQRTLANCEHYFQISYKLMAERLGLSPDTEWPLDQLWIHSLREWFEDLQDFSSP